MPNTLAKRSHCSSGVVAALASLLMLASVAIAKDLHVVIGSEDDDAAILFLPRQVEEGPDGNVYVLDWGDSYIKVYSPVGEFVRKIGGQGEGPGEFQRVEGASFGFTKNGELFFAEYLGGHHWITVVNLDGSLVRVLSPKIGSAFGIEKASSTQGGGFISLLAYSARSRANGSYYLYSEPQSLVQIDSTGAVVSEIVRVEHTGLISYLPNGATTNLPYTPEFAWALVGDDRLVWGDGMSRVLKVFTAAGELDRVVPTPLPEPKPVSKRDLEVWRTERKERISSRNPGWWSKFGRVAEEYDESLYGKPVFRRITTTPAGNWLVEGNSYSGLGESQFWLLDSRGALLGAVSAPAWRATISESFLLFLAYDDEELPVVHIVERRSDDTATLNLLSGF